MVLAYEMISMKRCAMFSVDNSISKTDALWYNVLVYSQKNVYLWNEIYVGYSIEMKIVDTLVFQDEVYFLIPRY